MKFRDDFNTPYDYKSNGCGSGWLAKLIPNTIYGVSIREACRRHDYSYEVGKTAEDKIIGDNQFLLNLLAIVEDADKWYYPTKLARLRAVDYYSAVRDHGDKAYWDGKDDESNS